MAGSGPTEVSYNIVLVGKTGTGKSATGNTILGRRVFRSRQESTSVTVNCQLESTQYEQIILNVIDTPGLMDTSKSKEEIWEKISGAISLCPNGFHAFLFVTQSTSRFTDEDIKTLNIIKSCFGPTFIQICILVFTQGDTFDMSEDAIPFEDWLNQQKGEMAKLVAECKNRCLLFYNTSKYPLYEPKRQENMRKLLQFIRNQKMKYTDEQFKAINARKIKMMIEDKLPEYDAKYQMQLSLITSKLNTINEKTENSKINDIQNDIKKVFKLIEEDDKGTNVLSKFKLSVYKLEQMVENLKKNKSKELAQKMAEWTQHIKNGPNQKNSFWAKCVMIGGSIATVATSFVPPVAVAVATGTTLAAGAIALAQQSENESYEAKLKRLESEMEQLEK